MGKRYFKVESEKGPNACRHCGKGTLYNVVLIPDDIAWSVSFERREDAEELAYAMDYAYKQGLEAGKAKRR